MLNALKKFWNDEEGVTMIEYALIVALVAIALVGTWQGLKTGVQTTLQNATDQLG